MKIVACMAVVCGVFAGQAAGAQVDLRKQSDASGSYEILFCARPSPTKLPGHAFVAFSHVTPAGKRDFLSIGHTTSSSPAEALVSLWGDAISGYLDEEKYTHVRQECLSVMVNEKSYTRAKGMTKGPLEALGLATANRPVIQSYKLNDEDCVTFVINVAKSLEVDGLKVPERQAVELPMAYIRRFISANTSP